MQKGDEKRIRTGYRKDDTYGIGSRDRDYSMTGYLMKKSVSPSYNSMAGLTQFPFPIVRLSELYLVIAEAAAESGDLETAKTYLDKVRIKSGIPTVEESWKNVPGVTLNQEKLVEIMLHRALHGRQFPVGHQALEGGRAICQDAHRIEHQEGNR